MKEKINSYRDLRVFNNAMDAAMKIFDLTKAFPSEEKNSLIDQIRGSSRSVCSSIGEAWRKRRYQNAFTVKLNDYFITILDKICTRITNFIYC